MRPTLALTSLRWVFDLALVAAVVAVLAALVVARGLPSWGHPTLAIIGGTKEPTIPKGAVVVLDPVAPSELRPGEVVTVRIPTESGHVTHRILDVGEADGATWIRTKGDANPTPDPALLPADDVVGRVGSWIPVLGYFVRLLSMPQGVVFMLAFALSLYATARLIEELEYELSRSRRASSLASPGSRSAATEPPTPVEPAPPAGPVLPMAPDPDLAALVAMRTVGPAWGPRSTADWSPRAIRPDAPVAMDPVAERPVTADPAAGLSPAARRAYRARTTRRRSVQLGGLA